MCVIIIKPAGVKMPDASIIEAAHNANPHGCGFVTPNLNYRGLNFTTFKRKLSQVKESEHCIIHFRLATHGSIKQSNCHPFNHGGIWFAHNGILNIRPKGDMTDSETALQDILYPAIVANGFGSKGMSRAVNSIIGSSKFAFLNKGKMIIYGDFINPGDGCYYSNMRFANPAYSMQYKLKKIS